MDADNKKPFKIKDITRNIKKAVVASSLEEIRTKVAEKFEKVDLLPTIHLDSDGTEIDDEEYFRTLEPNTELIAVFPGEHWIDETLRSMQEPSLCVAYLLLSGTSGWALNQMATTSSYALGSFSFLLGHSLLGFLHTTSPNPGMIVKNIFRQTSLLAEVAPVALLNAEFYLLTGFSKEYAYVHIASAILPLVAQILMEEHVRSVVNIAILGNLGSLIVLQSVKETGARTGGLIAMTALNHFVFNQLPRQYEFPKIEIVTIGLSIFAVFALNCLKDLSA